LLTDAAIKNPHSVLLLDEIEKAHPDLFNILLQVMDHATLTDNNGRKADFSNMVILMTSNVGSDSFYGQSIGFNADIKSVGQGAIDRTFRPEFRNRLDAIIKFNALPQEIIERVVDKFITQLENQLIDKNISAVMTSEARSWIANTGYSPQFGARSVRRLIQQEVTDPLADAVLFGELSSGGSVTITLEKDKLKLIFKPIPKKTNQKTKNYKRHSVKQS
jgi:ATP-dependent Clp protease ATP-binding subunit ClpA